MFRFDSAVALARLTSKYTLCWITGIIPPSIYITDWYGSPGDGSRMSSISHLRRSIPLAYGALLLTLALPKAREYWKLNGFSGSRLFYVLIRDQALYFAMSVLVTVRDLKELITLI